MKKMIKTILGQKIEQSQDFTSQGHRIPVTLIKAGPCPVVSKKTLEKDGCWALQLGFGKRKKAKLEKPPQFLAEARINEEEAEKVKEGDQIRVEDVFAPGDLVAVTGTSKGKGFAGVVKRFGFAGGPRTHGQSDRERAPGSIGATTTPGRVLKGKRMPGRMGGRRATIKNLKVMAVWPEKNLLTVSGLVPGVRKGFLLLERIGKVKNFDPIFKSEEKKEEKPKKEEKEERKVLTRKQRIKRRNQAKGG